METFLVIIVRMVDEGGFYGYMGTVNGTQTLGKIPLSLETIYDSFKIYSSLYFAYDVHLGTNQEFHSFVNFNACSRSTDSKFVSDLSVVQSFSQTFQ